MKEYGMAWNGETAVGISVGIVQRTNACTGPHKTHTSLQTLELGLLCSGGLNVVNPGLFYREKQKNT